MARRAALQRVWDLVKGHRLGRCIGRSVRNLFFPGDTGTALAQTITVEVSSICNARCCFCNYRFGYRGKHLMPANRFALICADARKLGYQYLDLTSPGGEITLHTELVEIIQLAHSAGFSHIGTYTNGILLHRFNPRALLNSGIDAMLISFPGFDEASFREIYGVDAFESFARSVSGLLTAHVQMNSSVYILFEPRTNRTQDELEETDFFQRHVKATLGPRIALGEPMRFFDTWGGDIISRDLPAGIRVDMNPVKSLAPFKKVHLCNRMLSLGIFADGTVRLCNCRYNRDVGTERDELFLGRIGEDGSLARIVADSRTKIVSLRREFAAGRLPRICRQCTFYQPVRLPEKVAG